MTTQKAWKPTNTKMVIANLKTIFKSGDIYKMRKSTYNFLYLVSGFIAHYNHQGFMKHYEDTADLLQDLKNSSDVSRPDYYYEAFFVQNEWSKAYYISKGQTLQAIAELVKEVRI